MIVGSPPQTVVDALKRVVKGATTEKSPKGEGAGARREIRPTREGAGAKRAAGKGVRQGSILPPAYGTYRTNELLALNAQPATIRLLLARGWREAPSANADVVRLISETQDIVVAQGRLQSEFPTVRFALNYVYFPANDSVKNGPPETAPASRSCDARRCYGPTLIKWHADLAGCANGVKVGIVDTALDSAHPALAWKKLDAHRPEGDTAKAPNWHGTAVVALLAGDPKSKTPGFIPGADYVIADAFFKNKHGYAETDTNRLVWALRFLEQHGAQVINMSLVGPKDALLHELVKNMSRKGTLFVAAAGNGGLGAQPAYPAAYDEVIAVTAVDDTRRNYPDANQGTYIDLAAPGVRIWTALPGNKEGSLSGTSFAAPFVTAIAAAVYRSSELGEEANRRPPLNPKNALLNLMSFETMGGARAGERDPIFGLGLVQAPTSCSPTQRGWSPTVQSERDEQRVND